MGSNSLSASRVAAGLRDAEIRPTLPVTGLPPVVYQHSNAMDAAEAVGAALPSIEPILSRLAALGFTVVSSTQALNSFADGNDAGTTGAQKAITDAAARAIALGAADVDPILLGTSMGSVNIKRWAALHGAACLVTFLDVDLDYTYQHDLNGFRAVIEAAHGVSWPAPLPATHDPGQMSGALSAIPQLLHHPNNDDFSAGVPPHNHPWPIEAYAAATGATVVTTGAQGHSDASIAATDIDQVLAFIEGAI